MSKTILDFKSILSLYYSFTHNYLNYENMAWAITNTN